jgi:hypothetical protein
MPSKAALLQADKADLVALIMQVGGFTQVRLRLSAVLRAPH